jgi:DNA-3-methyladenine glycosylase
MNIFPLSFFERPTEIVAYNLLGKILVSTIGNVSIKTIITETEAYGDHKDAASHAASGSVTAHNKPMFGPVGHTYVYQCYGMHICLNIVARENHKKAGAVLIRSVIPIAGIEIIQQRRKIQDNRLLTNGPGKVGQALGLSLGHSGINVMRRGPLYIIDNPLQTIDAIQATPRIGISRNKDILWRFVATIAQR